MQIYIHIKDLDIEKILEALFIIAKLETICISIIGKEIDKIFYIYTMEY